ncbi:E3 ubiquitin-protein ligase TRIM21-like [Trichomycterus rosablanca]|uniref:E3 ubiquitin-protein ligase TRIM21-like n=1 Tax=Trichomycterus rosablanca TaxID=2290929 RepID=UPI002F35501C
MAACSSLLSEEELQCSICLDVFTNPTSTPCGHNFCMICIKKYWDSSTRYECPVCKTDLPQKFDLRVNTFISGLAAEFKKSVQVKSSSSAVEPSSSQSEKVMCDTCTEEKLEAVKSCLDCGVSYCNSHLMPHKTAAKLKKHKLIDPVENLEDYICQKHQKPLEMFCRNDQTCVCQFCTESDHKYHIVVPAEEESHKKKAQLGETIAELQQMIQDRLQKIKELEQSVELNKKNTEKEKADSMKVFRSLMSCIERNQAELIKVMEEKQRAAERQAEEFIKDLKQEITELKRRNTELQQINTDDHIHFLQVYPFLHSASSTKDWNEIRLESRVSVKTLREALSKLQESLSKEIEKLPEIDLKRIQQYAVDVTLDPDTANSKLILSDDEKQVTHGDKRQNLPDSQERFISCPCVLGKQGFSSGRFYYEVQVCGKTDWALGVAKESINRTGKVIFSPRFGYWIVWLRNKTEYDACNSPPVPLSLKQAPQKVGVFVDYEEGLVLFYDVDARSHIYSFTDQSFKGGLYPYFCPSVNYRGTNSAPLIITPVDHEDSFLSEVIMSR